VVPISLVNVALMNICCVTQPLKVTTVNRVDSNSIHALPYEQPLTGHGLDMTNGREERGGFISLFLCVCVFGEWGRNEQF
jgi:hypothetical protein